MNKKGNIVLIAAFFVLLIGILFVGFIMVTGSSVINWVFDIAVPELSNMGMVGDTNMTEVAGYTIEPLDNVIQNFTWLTGVLYILMLVASVGFAFVSRMQPEKWLIGFYIACVLIMVMASILVSNIYEEFYDGSDELATRLQEHTLLSWMILYSPMVLTIIAFATGIILFSGFRQEEFV